MIRRLGPSLVVALLASPAAGCATSGPPGDAPPIGADSAAAAVADDGGATVCQGQRCITTLATDTNLIGALASDGTYLYWTSGTDAPVGTLGDPGAVRKVPVSGGASSVLVRTLAAGPASGLTLDANNVYWTEVAGDVAMAPLTGCAPARAIATGFPSATGIAVDAENVYWGTSDDVGYVMRAPIGGGTPVTLAAVYNSPRSMVVDQGNVYWVGGSAGDVVMSVPADGGATQSLATSPIAGSDMVLARDALYWINYPATSIQRTPLDGGPTTTLVSGFQMAWALATDGFALYVTDFGAREVDRVPLDGGRKETLISDVDLPSLIAVDDQAVYIESDTSLMKIAPK